MSSYTYVCVIFIYIYANDIQLPIFCEGFDLAGARSSMIFLHTGVDLLRRHSGTSVSLGWVSYAGANLLWCRKVQYSKSDYLSLANHFLTDNVDGEAFLASAAQLMLFVMVSSSHSGLSEGC